MLHNLDKVHWSVVHIMSPECNLDCAYCNIAWCKKTSTCSSGENSFFQNTIKSIEDGTYLKNIKAAFDRFHQNPNDIIEFEIWGQEPTLVLKALTPVWKDWIEYFPNLMAVGFSTNGVANSKELADFVIEVDRTANNPINMDIQWSFDGLYGENAARKYTGESNDIVNNLIKVINYLNPIKLNKVHFGVSLHAVLSVELLKFLNTAENLHLYLTDYDNNIQAVQDSIINKNISYNSNDLITQNCDRFDSFYGIDYFNFIHALDKIRENGNYKFFDAWKHRPEPGRMLMGSMVDDIVTEVVNSNCNTLNEYIDNILRNKEYYNNSSAMCGSLTACLRISYDGCVYDCHASIYDNHMDESKIQNTVFDQSRLQWNKHKRIVNLITDSDEMCDDLIDFYHKTHSGTVALFMFNNLVNQFYLLSRVGQIDPEYQFNFDKIKRHAFIMSRYNQCYNGLKVMNGSIFLRGNEEIRQLGNGALDTMEDVINGLVEHEKENRREGERRN